MQHSLKINQDVNCNELYKTSFLSYFISLYVSSIQQKNKGNKISVNEIYEFIQDLKIDLGLKTPTIEKRDISLCFYILDRLGVCSCLR